MENERGLIKFNDKVSPNDMKKVKVSGHNFMVDLIKKNGGKKR